MGKHAGLEFRCAWCLIAFETAQGVKAHERAKHFRNMPLKDEEWQRLELEREHRRRIGASTGKLSPAKPGRYD